MFGLLDQVYLLKKRITGSSGRNYELICHRGNGKKNTIIFLPWKNTFEKATKSGLVPKNFLACFQLPKEIVSADANVSLKALWEIESVFEELLVGERISQEKIEIVGLSIGNFPATYLANKHSFKLISICSGVSSGDLIFSSPVTKEIAEEAIEKNINAEEINRILKDYSPLQNLSNLAPDSMFISGKFDKFLPDQNRKKIYRKLKILNPAIRTKTLPFGHLMTLFTWRNFV